MTEKQFTIGTDPEFFLTRKETGQLLSAIPFIEGTKHEPQLLPKGGNVQRDNVAVEFATDPADTMMGFVESIRNTLGEVVKVLPADTEIVALPSAKFPEKELEHPEAQMFGCEPDYSAWTVSQNPKPEAADSTFRSCGAHVHVGSTGNDENAFLLEFDGKIAMAKAMDCLHGMVSTILDNNEAAIARRQLYGQPSAHRPTDYGLEYRALSNYWLKSPVTVMMIYHLTNDALDIVREGKIDGLIEAMGAEEIQRVIMEGDADAAAALVEEHVLPVLNKDSVFYFNEALAKVKANDMDFHGEWGLYGKEIAA